MLRAEIQGTVKVNSKLSGMPELRLGLNDKVKFEANERSAYFPFLYKIILLMISYLNILYIYLYTI